MSGVGLSKLAPAFNALQLPMLVDSFEKLDRLRSGMEPRLRDAIDKAGFKALNFSDVGWVHFFTVPKAHTPEDLKKLKLFINSDDPATEALYRDLGFRPVPLGVTDMLTALQTGLIEAFDVPPLLALSDQSFGVAKHMIDLKWAPLIGATIIDKKTWERVPETMRPELERIAEASGAALRNKIRASGDDAIAAMKRNGLIVESLTPAELAAWKAMGKTAREELKKRGMVSAADYDEVALLSVDPVSGAWLGDWGPGPTSRNRIRLSLVWEGAAVTGTLQSVDRQHPDVPLQKSTFDPKTNSIHLEATVPGARGAAVMRHVVDGKLSGDTVSGSWTAGASKADFKLSRIISVSAK
jgi:TRAP-type C4-dicarboxylate transport system substrate-binding protein